MNKESQEIQKIIDWLKESVIWNAHDKAWIEGTIEKLESYNNHQCKEVKMAKKIKTNPEETKALPLEKAVHVEFEDKENVNWDELKAKVKNDEEH